MPNPTIVSASLDDKELQQSIANLVAHVKRGLHTMLTDTNSTVDAMEKKLKSLGNLKIDSGGSADGGASKRTSKLKEEENQTKANTQAIKENTAAKKENLTFDQQQKGLQTAMGVKSARDSFYAFAQGYKKQAQEIAQYIQAFESGLNRVIQNRLNELNAQLSASKEKIRKLNEELNRRNFASGNPQAQAQVQAQLDKELKTQNQIQKAIANVNNEYAFEKTYLASLYAEHHRISNMMREETSATQQQTQAQQQLTQGAKEYSEQVKKIAAEIRESAQWQKPDKFGFKRGMMNLDGRAYPVTENLEMGLRLEDQIVSILQRANEERQKGVQITQQQAQASHGLSEEDRKAAEQLGWIEEKMAKRRYISPSMEEISQIRAALQSITGQQEKWVDDIDKTKASYNQLSQYLKELKTIYADIWRDPNNANAAKVIAQEMQTVQREMQKWQQAMSRPVSLKAALSGSEKTLDDIAYKIQRLRAYKQGIDLTKPNAANEIKQVDEALAKLQKDADKWMSKSQQMIKNNTALGRSWSYMKNRLAFYFTVGVGISFIRDLVRVRSEYEMNEKALGTLLNSAERGTRIFNELSNMALVSPYTLIELSAAAKQLTAYDVAAKDVVDTTRRLADISAAVGIPVERLTYALGQVKAYGHLTSQDARQFLNAGVPLVKELANRYTELEGKLVSTADVYDRMKKHAISYNDVLSVLTSMTDEGGRFFDYQAKMADTLKVRIANLALAYNNMLNEIGRSEGGAFVTGIKGVTAVLKHWREIERVLGTIIVSIGAYRTATFLAGITTQKVGGHSVAAWLRLSRVIRTTQGNVALLSATMKAIPFAGWVTMIMSLVSYFVFFNNSTDETKQKLEDIATAFEGIRKEVTNLFADAISTDNIGTQMSKLKDILDLAETELGVTIPINLENVNESNIKQKLKEAKQHIDEYLNFSQRFSEEAVDTPFNEEMNKFGSAAKSTYTSISESINAVKVALKELADEGKASKRDIEILNELSVAPKDGESRIEHLQRMVGLYEELGLIGQKKVEPMIEHNFFKAYFTSTWDNMEELAQRQENALDRLGIKNKTVYENMLKDVQNYYSSSSIASYQLEQQVMRVAESIDIMNIPVKQRTMKLEVAINQEAAKNNWNDFEKEFAFQVANTKFGTTIEISEDSKKDAEIELSDWQKRMQSWADKHGITFSLNFMGKEDEKTYADRMLQAAKDAKGKLDVLRRKLKVGTGSQTDVDNATKDYNNARLLALKAGADLSSLDKKSASSRKAASKAESELAKALKEELSTIDKVRSIYKDLTKEGMSHAYAVERATRGWDETVNAINKVLQKNGLQKLDLSKFAGIENPRELVNMLQSQLNTLLKRGAKPAEIKELQTKVNTLEVDADKYDLTKITKGLNSELDKLKDEYELAVELDANPELGDMFADMFGINTSTLPKTFGDALDRAQIIINRKLAEMNITTPFDLMEGNIDSFAKSTGLDKDSAVIKELVSAQNAYRDMFKKNITETEKILDDYIKKYGDYSDKIEEIEAGRLEKLKKLNEAYYTEEMRKRPEYAAKLNAIEQGASKEKQQVDFDEFKNSRYYTMMFENLDYISTKTIRDMRDRVRELIDTMNDLTPEQLKTLMSQYEKLEQKLVKRSPFKTLTKDLKEYFATSKERKAANQEFKNAQKEYDAQKKNVAALKEKYEQAKAISNTSKSYLDFLQIEIGGENEILKILKKQLDAAQKKADKYNLTAKLAKSEALAVANVVGQNLQSLGELRDFLQQDLGIELSDELNGLVDGLSKVGQGINKITSSATSGDVVGVITGVGQTIYGLYDGIASLFGGSKKDYFTPLKESLENLLEVMNKVSSYQLEALGRMTGSQAASEYRKLLQNNETIIQSYRDLANAAGRSGSSLGSHSYAYRTNRNLKGDWEEISKYANETVTSIQDMYSLDPSQLKEIMTNMPTVWAKIDKKIREALEGIIEYGDKAQEYTIALGEALTNISLDDLTNDFEGMLQDMDSKSEDFAENFEEYMRNAIIRSMMVGTYAEELKNWYNNFKERIKDDELSEQDVEAIRQEYMDIVNRALEERGRLTSVIGEAARQGDLSSLQQGIQGITEDTAGALEAITNGISQQCYLQSDLLTQIRDAVVGMDIDIQTATQAQMLLQLQQSFQVQQSIQSILEGVLVPSGRAFSVELIS